MTTVPEPDKKVMTPAYESMQVKLANEKLSRLRHSKQGFHKGDGDNPRIPIKSNTNTTSKVQKHISKIQPSSTIGPLKKQPQQSSPRNNRFVGTFPKLEGKNQTANTRPRSKPLQNIQLRTSLSFKDNNNNNNESSSNSNIKTDKRNPKQTTPKPKALEPPKINKSSPYKNHQLPSIYSQGSRPRSRQVKDATSNNAAPSTDETVLRPLSKWSSLGRLDKFESMYHESLPKVDISKNSGNEKTIKTKQSRLKPVEIAEPCKEKHVLKSGAVSKQTSSDKVKISTTAAAKANKIIPSRSPPSSRQAVPVPLTNWMESSETDFAAVLLQTTKVIEGAMECTGQQAAINNDGSKISQNSTISDRDTTSTTKREEHKVDNIDNLPYPIESEVEGQGQSPKTETINPPVNTPVSPRSPISDPSDTSSPVPSFTKKTSYSDEDDKGWSKDQDVEMDHDFVTDYLQLESMKEVNSITQAMCRSNICREFKGADSNLTLEELKLSKSHYLQIPCFADAKFFTKIKIPPNIFMNGKRPDKDLITIQYLQEKMDNVYQNNLKAFESLKKSKPIQTSANSSGKDLNVDTALSKERYIQSISKLFQSLQLPQWAKECFGSDEEGIASSAGSTEEELQAKSAADPLTDRSALAKRILNLFDNGKIKQMNNDTKTSRLKKASVPKDCDDDTSSDNVSESP
ncbi:unnamed protein product [Allacma fusca]|uniref:Uncharacterized protein n=1 Tax=Allacma fusca TaxID=39272 RepID=A0A8J2LME3_9HEXA|nr:unnamed protein product [Allacma fusca]